MKRESLYQYIKNCFDEYIVAESLTENEIYIEVTRERVKEINYFIHKSIECTLVSMFANDERPLNGHYGVYYVYALRGQALLLIIKTCIKAENPVMESVAEEVHAALLYEREIHDLFGIVPAGHPDLRDFVFHGNWPEGLHPLRKDFPKGHRPQFVQRDEIFMRVEGRGVYEIPVGPVHAGIIEPGHFRFSVAGEPVINLEAKLFYVHKGIEKLCEGESIEKVFYFSERISGDETFSNSLAYCQAIEKIGGVVCPERAALSRVVFCELERICSHLNDLIGLCNDVAFGFGASQLMMIRAWNLNLNECLTGSRYLRSVNRIGGLRKDFILGKEKITLDEIRKMKEEFQDTVKIIKNRSLFIDRVENTGVLPNRIAADLNAVGPAGRSAGIDTDVRRDFPYAGYSGLQFQVPLHHNGDVNCRMNVKIEELNESFSLIEQAISLMKAGSVLEEIKNVPAYAHAFGMTESPRGENIHWVMTGENNTIFRYKVRTPSFCNWPVLCHAVKGNIVPDFPLINKSFNLSYSGNDL